MLKNYFIISFILFGTLTVNSQELEKKIFDTICNCVEKSSIGSEENGKTEFMSCFENVFEEINREGLFDEILKNADSTNSENLYELGYDLGAKYMDNFLNNNYANFIWKCDSYYHAIKKSRLRELEEYVNDANSEKMKSLTYKIENFQIKNQFLLQRGIYYLALKKYSEAKNDLDRLLGLDPNNYEAIMYKALALEELKEFDKAAALYKKSYDETDSIYFMIFHEIAKRRKAEMED